MITKVPDHHWPHFVACAQATLAPAQADRFTAEWPAELHPLAADSDVHERWVARLAATPAYVDALLREAVESPDGLSRLRARVLSSCELDWLADAVRTALAAGAVDAHAVRRYRIGVFPLSPAVLAEYGTPVAITRRSELDAAAFGGGVACGIAWDAAVEQVKTGRLSLVAGLRVRDSGGWDATTRALEEAHPGWEWAVDDVSGPFEFGRLYKLPSLYDDGKWRAQRKRGQGVDGVGATPAEALEDAGLQWPADVVAACERLAEVA